NYFSINARAVGFFGQYLVFIERESYDRQTGTQPLRFINLDYFRPAIGNAALPIFTLPIKTSDAITRFDVENGKLVVNGKRISPLALKALSDIYQLVFNLSVGLVDPETKIRTEVLASELLKTFYAAIRNT